MGIGQRLKESRIKSGKSQQEVANLVGISQSSIGHYESGRYQASLDTIVRLAEIYAVSVNWLMTGEKDDGTAIDLFGGDIPKELADLNITYLRIAKDMQNKQISPETIKQIIDALYREKNKA